MVLVDRRHISACSCHWLLRTKTPRRSSEKFKPVTAKALMRDQPLHLRANQPTRGYSWSQKREKPCQHSGLTSLSLLPRPGGREGSDAQPFEPAPVAVFGHPTTRGVPQRPIADRDIGAARPLTTTPHLTSLPLILRVNHGPQACRYTPSLPGPGYTDGRNICPGRHVYSCSVVGQLAIGLRPITWVACPVSDAS